MRRVKDSWTASPTDLAGFLACRHRTGLDAAVAREELVRPRWSDPLGAAFRARGEAHERRYVEALREAGRSIEDLTGVDPGAADLRLGTAMKAGVDAIVQAPLRNEGWVGQADVLRRIEEPCSLGGWSYEVVDTKLARETRGGTILQLCVYTELLGALQGRVPERFHVVTPAGTSTFRFEEFAAYYRLVKSRFGEFLASAGETPYPEPVELCSVCSWFERCDARRRRDDHLSFVASLGRMQQRELESHEIATLSALAATPLPLPFVPARGAKETYERLREQARLQVAQRESGAPVFELLAPPLGLASLPEPSPGDLFLDLEGDPFAREGGREYLFGLGRSEASGAFAYTARWATSDAEERRAFEAVVDEVIAELEAHPGAHVYHYAPYEPAAFKRLMGRYSTRAAEIDRLLRGERFVDLYAVVRGSLRAGVESYSIKSMEPFYGFERDVELARAGDQRRLVEAALELDDPASITAETREAVEGYNRDDCLSTRELRAWLETLRSAAVAGGADLPRPEVKPGEASEKVSAREQAVEELRGRLLAGVPAERSARSEEQQALYLLAYMLDWHRREDKVAWWEYYRLLQLEEDALHDEPAAICGLEHVARLQVVVHKRTGRPTGSVVDRYRFPHQETEIRRGDVLRLRDESTFGTVVDRDRAERTIDVKKGTGQADVHPTSAFKYERVPPDVPEAALFRIGEHVAEHGIEPSSRYATALQLILRRPPVIGGTELAIVPRLAGETETELCTRATGALDGTVLPIQGPPGAGKTHTGAEMIFELVRQGRRVGVTATSHKVIRNLLDKVAELAAGKKTAIRIGHKVSEADPVSTTIRELEDNEEALRAVEKREIEVLGGTVWLWARPDAAATVDVLFVDEAGQMSLANALAAAQAADNLVLLGDPRQLEQPKRGSHPDGVDVAALQHVLGEHETMPRESGIFLPTTWRLAPAITAFTSPLFYEGRLESKPGLEHQRLDGTGAFDGAGLWLVPVGHTGNQSYSLEEVETVLAIVRKLLAPGAAWIDEKKSRRTLTPGDVLVVSPFNAQVTRIEERLAQLGVAVGTVDRFQGREAPVVIYSMATSRPEDAPRGMEFLYALDRFNVATSRARCAAIVVASPRLFEPDCSSPRQMKLANALCFFREKATVVSAGDWSRVSA